MAGYRGKKILKLLLEGDVKQEAEAVPCNIKSQRIMEVEQLENTIEMPQPGTSGTQKHITKSSIESSDEEDISSSSEYCPSYDDDSDVTEPESDIDRLSSSYNLNSLMKVKRKVLFDNLIHQVSLTENKTTKQTENLQKGNMGNGKNNENKINVHVTADGIQPTIKKKKIFELLPKLSKKRMRNPQNWKRKKAATLRQK
ncbi:unnamed protein product, partial [Callosobruchus maculatus]